MSASDTLRRFGASPAILRSVVEQSDQTLQGFWLDCDRADYMAWYLGALGKRGGHGSQPHRRAVLIACLLARTTSRWWSDSACEAVVDLAEQWAWDKRPVTGEDLRALGGANRVIPACAAASGANAAAVAAAFAAFGKVYVARYDDIVADVAVDTYAAAAAYAAATAAAAGDADMAACNGFSVAREAHLSALADLIRLALPEVPL